MAQDSVPDPSEADSGRFGLAITEQAGRVVVSLRGEVDLYTSPRLTSALAEVTASGATVLLDVADLEFIDSTGLVALVGALKRARDNAGDIVLRHPTRSMRKLLEIANLSDLFQIEDSGGAAE